MNIKSLFGSVAAVFLLISCDSDTSSLGGSLIPEEDNLIVETNTYSAKSRSILIPDSVLSRTSMCYLGRYTDPNNGSFVNAGYLTQVNCIEGFQFPDSVYGIKRFTFPTWVDEEMKGVEPFKANLRLYFKSMFGDVSNSLKIEVYPLDQVIDVENRYYADINPADFYDESLAPLASVMISPTDYVVSDSIRQLSNYYSNISINLPDSIAEILVNKYFEPNGSDNFADAGSFINNVCKGYYLRCVQGDGTILYIDKTVLNINFKYLEVSSSGYADSLLSVEAEFSGNSEVMQMNKFENKGMDKLIADEGCTYISSPYGVLTEVTLPIDEIKKNKHSINSANIKFYRINEEYLEYKPGVTSPILLLRKDNLHTFFEENKNVDNITSYYAYISSTYNTFTFDNIARLIEDCYEDRENWLTENGYESNETGFAAYRSVYPDWDKVVLVPVQTIINSSSSVVGFRLDTNINSVKLVGGPAGEMINIKVITSTF